MRAQSGTVEEARQIEPSLGTATRENRLFLHYQPMFSVDGRVQALEALIRLRDEKLGLLQPGRFIPIAEESGLIHEIGLWVVREACRQSREWLQQGLQPVPVSINVSAAQFLRGDLVEGFRQALDEFGISPAMLEIEVTESLLMENTEQSTQQLGLFKALGVKISMDDFGTGYSSLSYLHMLPIDKLKIDRSFIQKIDGLHSDPVVPAIVELGRNLGLTVVAEGVETEEQRQELTRLGCDLLQGYLLSKPCSAEEIKALLPAGAPRT